MAKKERYTSPCTDIILIEADIITYSEGVELELPPIQAGHEDDQQ